MTTTLNEYDLGAIIGRGPTGTVRRGTQEGSLTPVAIKIVRRELAGDPHWVARLVDERARLDRVEHSNIVTILDLVIGDGSVLIVSKMVEGADLGRLLESEPRIAAPVAARMIGEVLSALAVAHTAGIAHGSVKPENVIVRPDGHIRVY